VRKRERRTKKKKRKDKNFNKEIILLIPKREKKNKLLIYPGTEWVEDRMTERIYPW